MYQPAQAPPLAAPRFAYGLLAHALFIARPMQALQNIETALGRAGARMPEVVRTHMSLRPRPRWIIPVARA